MSGATPIKLVILLSGEGRTLQNFIDLIGRRHLDATIELVVSSHADAPGVTRARKADLPVEIVGPNSGRLLAEVVERSKPDLILLAGFVYKYTNVSEYYRERVMNIHPALLPSFGGNGMYGDWVHKTVLASGVKLSGCTVHFVTDEYDAGPIIIQRTCPVLEGDTPGVLAERVFVQECIAYPAAVRLFAQQRLTIDGRLVRINHDRAIYA